QHACRQDRPQTGSNYRLALFRNADAMDIPRCFRERTSRDPFFRRFRLRRGHAQCHGLAGEYSPSRIRVTVMMLVSNFFNVGAAIGGFIASGLIPRFGWRSVFIFGGVVPLIITVVMIFLLPESLQFMVLRGQSQAKILRWLSRIGVPLPPRNTQLVANEEYRKGVPVVNLFREGRGLGTV